MAGLFAREGGDFIANSTTFDDQRRPTVVKLANGNFVVIWDDISRAAGGPDDVESVRGQLFSPTGARIGAEFLVNTSIYKSQTDSHVAPLSHGGFVVTWTDYNTEGTDNYSSSVKAQMFDSAGARIGGETLANTTIPGYQMSSAVSGLPGGGYVAVWVDVQGPLSIQGNIRGQRFDGTGAKVGGEFTVNTLADNRQTSPSVTTLADGRFVVTWTDGTPGTLDGSGYSVRGQMFNVDGSRIGSEFQVNQSAYANQLSQSVTALAGGGFVAIWADQQGFPGSDLFEAGGSALEAQIFDADGNRVGGEFVLNPVRRTSSSGSTVAAMADGSFVVSWNDFGYRDNDEVWSHIAAQAFDARGNRLGDQFYLETHRSVHDQTSLAALDGGRFVAVWHSGTGSAYHNNYPGDIRVQLFAPARGVLDIALSNGELSETRPNNIEVGTIIPTSEAVNARVSYEIVGDSTGGAFRIEGDRIVVADNSRLDYEAGAALTLTIRAYDGAGGHYDETLRLTLVDAAIERRWAAGEEAQVNTTISWDQEDPVVAALGGGGHVVIWEDPDSGGDRFGPSIKGQLFGADGSRSGREFLVNGPMGGQQYDPAAAPLAGGGFVVGWTEWDPGSAEGYSVKAKIYDSAGRPIAGELGEFFLQADPAQAGDQDQVAFAGLSSGGFAAAWHDQNGDGSFGAVKLRLFGAAGEAIGAERVINTDTAGDQHDPAIARLASGGLVVTWTDPTADPSVNGIKGQRLDSTGNPIGGEFVVASGVGASHGASAVAGLSGGGFIIVWQQTSGPVRAQVFDSSGTKVGGEIVFERSAFQIDDSSRGPAVTALPDGGFMIAVQGDGGPGLDRVGIVVQQFDAAGRPVGSAWLANDSVDGQQDAPALATLASGGIAAAWVEPVNSPSSDGNGNSISGRIFQPVDQQSRAFGDLFATDEATPVSGNVRSDNGSGSDTGPGRVASVNGSPAAVGQTISLASGALLTLNADGSFVYDPNNAFDSLVGPESGAANGAANDSFSYALEGGSSADVTVRVAGISAPGEAFLGGTGDDRITGTGGNDLFRLNQGGDDYASGGGGDDVFWFGTAMNWLDQVGGGAGQDRVVLQGNYQMHFGTGSFFEVERLVLLSSQDASFGGGNPQGLYAYNLSLLDPAVHSGHRLTVDASGLRPGEVLSLGAIGLRGTLTVHGGAGHDSIAAGTGNDLLLLQEGGEDSASGGEGNDVFYFGAALSAGDVANGGEGRDAIVLQGHVTAVLTNASLVGIESISIQSGANATFGDTANNFYDFDLTTADGNVAAGQQLIVNAQSLRVGEDFTFDGSAESDGKFLVYGGHGVDNLTGGAGADVFLFEGQRWGANDKVDGGGGRDALVISAGSGLTRIEFGADSLTSIESISLNNRYATDPSQKPSYDLVLHNGNVAPGGTLIVNGSSIPLGQVVMVDGRAVTGGGLILFGGSGHDTLYAGGGADLIVGGSGADGLAGFGGADVFRYDAATDSTAAAPDLIADFQTGIDKIDLSRIDANTHAAGDQAFTWIGSNAFTGSGAGSAGQLRVYQSNGYQRIEGDTNGDGTADLVIVLQIGTAPLVQTDFLP